MSRLPLYAAASVATAISAGAFTLSFAALSKLALDTGVVNEPWIFPLIIDLTILAATMAVVALRNQPGCGYAWFLLTSAAAMSIAGNAAHAWPHGPVAVAVGIVPPAMLLAVTHLCVILARAADEPAAEPVVEIKPLVTSLPRTAVPVDLTGSFRKDRVGATS